MDHLTPVRPSLNPLSVLFAQYAWCCAKPIDDTGTVVVIRREGGSERIRGCREEKKTG